MKNFLFVFLFLIVSNSTKAQGDFCSNAETIVPSSLIDSWIKGTSNNATGSTIGCSGNADDDVWYTFVANSSSMSIKVDPTIGYDPVIELFQAGNCSGVSLACKDDNGINGDEEIALNNLVNGSTYTFRVYHYGVSSGSSSFKVCVTGLVPAINNLPCNAIVLPEVSNSLDYQTYTTLGSLGSNVATPSFNGVETFQSSYKGGDVWFSVVVPSNGKLQIQMKSIDFGDGVLALYSGPCSSPVLVDWNDDSGAGNMPYLSLDNLMAGAIMYIRIWEFGNDNNGQFQLKAGAIASDNCSSAPWICDLNGYTGNTSSSYTSDFPGNMTGTGQNGVANSNPSAPFGQFYSGSNPSSPVQIDNNSWLAFTASATTAVLNVVVSNCSNNQGIQMQIFGGSFCNNFTAVSNMLETTGSQTVNANGLTVGQTYYIMVDGFAGDVCDYTISANSGVQVVEVTPQNASVCVGSSTSLTATVTGNTSSLNYTWSSVPSGSYPSTQTISVSPTVPTTYTVSVTGRVNCNGITSTASTTVSISPPISVTANPAGPYCSSDSGPYFLSGSPSGGTWSGFGRVGSFFFPFIAGAGSHTLTYTYTNSSGCSGSDNITVLVNPSPNTTIATTTGSVCIVGGNVNLAGSPSGGTWSGTGVSGPVFSPSVAGVGNHTITYSVTSSNGCTTIDTHSITVTGVADATISSIPNLCDNDSPYSLSAVDGGGTWSGVGVSGSSFDPSVAGAGTHIVTYTIPGICGDSDTKTIIVFASPNAVFFAGGPYCFADSPINLTPTTSGGAFSGAGVSGTSFDPGVAGVGSHIITYSITNANNCTKVSTQTIVVNTTPNPAITSAAALCSGDSPMTLTAQDNGGVWTGAGITGDQFNPTVAGAGNHTINYSVTLGNCNATSSYDILVTQSQDATITSVGPYCPTGGEAILESLNPGGVWSGPGIIDANLGIFDPSIGVGFYDVIYTLSGTCSDADTVTFEVTTDACDYDGDGVLDINDPDDDNDGILDINEDADLDGDGDHTTNPTDTDGDGIPDFFDLDSDNDGIVDAIEGGGEDPDGDGVIGVGPITDVDNDGLSDIVDPSEGGIPFVPQHADSDGLVDAIDIDADDDGIVDNIEGQSSFGYIAPSGSDTDQDGIDDSYDLDNGGTPIVPEDTDDDSVYDYADTDADNDALDDIDESNDPYIAPSNNDSDGDGLDNAFDVDGTSSVDNGGPSNNGTVPTDFINNDKPSTPQLDWREQLDHDNDGVTDVDDPDDDNDGVLDVDEDANFDGDNDPGTNPTDTDGDGIPDYFDLDSDNDGIVDVIEGGGEDPDGDGIIGVGPITDVDNDGLSDIVDPSEGGTPLPIPDTDGDGLYDFLDLDADDDGVVDNIEGQTTIDYIAPLGVDSDEDGIDDAYDLDNGGTPIAPIDTDEDESPDYTDLNADNDNENDLIEAWDLDNDDIPETEPTGNDSDYDGIDDAFDVDGTSSVNNGGPTNGGSLATDFPNLDDDASSELDWREVETFVEVPNIFTPNGDGINDVFIIDNSNIKTLTATIVNRWGQVVYDWHGVNGSWDGHTKSGQEASEGTYYYVVTGEDNTGEVYLYKGALVLKR